MKKGGSFARRSADMGDQIPEGLELLTAAARPMLERWFETEVLKTTLATDAVIGAFASISQPGTAYVLLHHVMGTAGGAPRRLGLRSRRHGGAVGFHRDRLSTTGRDDRNRVRSRSRSWFTTIE